MFNQCTKWMLAAFLVAVAGCDRKSPAQPSADATPQANAPADAPKPGGAPADAGKMVKLSQFGGSQYCSIARGADGTLHAIFTDRPDPTKPSYIYYRASHDGGATWSDPKNISDDESGISVAYCRVLVDGKGRVYAIWKYLTSNNLDGPGGAAGGLLAYRCLEGGTWAKTYRFCTKNAPAVSWFAANGPGGQVHVIWSQGNLDRDWEPYGGVNDAGANLLQQSILDGPTPAAPKGLIVPKPLPTQAEIDAAHAAGKDIPNEDRYPKSDGLWDLRGFIAPDGSPRFIGEGYAGYAPNTYTHQGTPVMYWDGKGLKLLYRFEPNKTPNNFNNPWTLLVDAQGKEHLIRKPENAEKPCVRDYSVENGEMGDPVEIIATEKATGSITGWFADQLPDGKMAVMAAVSQKGGWAPDDVELYVSTSTGGGKWSKLVNITNNEASQKFANHETAAGGVATSSTYRPDFAEAVSLDNGGLGVLMVNTESTILGITNSGVTPSGRVVGGLSTTSSSSPWVFFRKL